MGGREAEDVANLVKSWEPDFIVTVGDNNYPSGAAETMDKNVGQFYHEFIHPYRGDYGPGAEVNRFFPALGNHDFGTANGQPYFDYFTLPGNERYYTVTHELVDLLILNSMPGEPDGIDSESVQAAWLRQALADSTACWNLVVFHHTPYSSGLHGSAPWMQWPYEEWGAHAVLAGHEHHYERIVHDGFPYFVNGVGGGAIYVFNKDNPVHGSEFLYNDDYGAMLVEGTRDSLRFDFYTTGTRTGESGLLDTYTLTESACP